MASTLFSPITLRGLTISNRITVSPMCQYSAIDGVPQDWHFVHLGQFAFSGPGLIFTEATGVEPDGRITLGCTGLYDDATEEAFARIVDLDPVARARLLRFQVGAVVLIGRDDVLLGGDLRLELIMPPALARGAWSGATSAGSGVSNGG